MNIKDYKNVWVFAEQRDGVIMNVSLELLGEGHRLSRAISEDTKVCAIVVGDKVDSLADQLFEYGADAVYLAENELLKHYTTDGYAKVVTDAIREHKPEIVLFGATHIGRDLAPRIAARLDTGLTADCTRLDINVSNYMDYLETYTTASMKGLERDQKSAELKQTRPAFGGNLMATIICPNTRPQMSTVRPGVMSKLEPKKGAKGDLIKLNPQLTKEDIQIEIMDVVKACKECVCLTDATIICSGGRGLGEASGFELVQAFADRVGGVVGASRAAVDSGWIDHSHQVGQTGTTVKPNIYFAFGISGAIQHQAGMSHSDIIIAVNKDPDAPIFQIADYGIVGDVKKVIPELIAQWEGFCRKAL